MRNEPRPFVLSETNWKAVKGQEYSLAVLPWGATEVHNYHLPYGTDTIQAENVAIEAARIAWMNKARPIVLPSIPFGVNTGQIDIPFCINMNPSTQYAVLQDIVETLEKQRIQKLVILNSHGGNNFKQMIRELGLRFPDVFVCSIDWWKIGNPKAYFDEPGDHAGELETSAMMYLTPEWVLPLSEAGSGETKTFKVKGLREGWVTSQRQWSKVTSDTGAGNPKESTAQKGKDFLNEVNQMIAEFLEELHHADLEDMYD